LDVSSIRQYFIVATEYGRAFEFYVVIEGSSEETTLPSRRRMRVHSVITGGLPHRRRIMNLLKLKKSDNSEPPTRLCFFAVFTTIIMRDNEGRLMFKRELQVK
jgi:hypothetical protein